MRRATATATAAFILAAAGTFPAWATQPAPGRAAVLESLAGCRGLADAARLACYDRAVAALDQAEKAGDVVVVDRAQIRQAEREAFGFNLPSLRMFDRAGREAAPESVTLKIAQASRGQDGSWTFTTEEGQVWRQTDGKPIVPRPKPGAALEVRRGVLGAFFLSVNGDKAVRGERVR